MNPYLLIIVASCMALQVVAKEKTDLATKKMNGPVAAVTETTLTCPKLVHYACIMRSPPVKKYQTVRTTHITDEHGNQVESEHYNFENSLIARYYWHYNEHNYKTEAIELGSDGSQLSRVVYKYDNDNYPAAIDFYDKNNKLINTVDETAEFFDIKFGYNYNEHGNMIEQTMYAEDGKLLGKMPHNVYTSDAEKIFDDKDKETIDRRLNKDGALKTLVKRVFEYDKNGGVTSEKIYRYEHFDKNGNWQKVITWAVNDHADVTLPVVFIVTREITYFQ